MRKFLVLPMLAVSMQAFSGDVDYLGYADRVNLLTELAISAKSCERTGMIVDWDKVRETLFVKE